MAKITINRGVSLPQRFSATLAMEVEITTLEFKLDALGQQLKAHNEKVYYEGMFNELETLVGNVKDIARLYGEYEAHKVQTCDKLERVKVNLLETGKNMMLPIADWGLPAVPFNEEEYSSADFSRKIAVLTEYNNFLIALRETYPVMLARYFPCGIFFKNELGGLVAMYNWVNKCQEIWKNCMTLRIKIFNFQDRLENVIMK